MTMKMKKECAYCGYTNRNFTECTADDYEKERWCAVARVRMNKDK